MVYKDLQKRHLPTLRKKGLTSKLQAKLVSIQSKIVQSGRTFASVTRIENSQSMSNLPSYTKTNNTFKHSSVYRKIHARIPERNERIHG